MLNKTYIEIGKLLAVGLLGIYIGNHMMSDDGHQKSQPVYSNQAPTKTPSNNHDLVQAPTNSAKIAAKEFDVETALNNKDPEIRLTALSEVWKTQRISNFNNIIDNLSENDNDYRVKTLASWIGHSNDADDAFIEQGKSSEPTSTLTTANQNIDEQIQQSLYLDESENLQDNEQLTVDHENLVEPVYSMTEKEQKEYINTLSENQDDQSIEVINNLVLENDQNLKNLAIDKLIEILGNDTGHYDVIKRFLEDNSSYLSYDQIDKINSVTSNIDKRRLTYFQEE